MNKYAMEHRSEYDWPYWIVEKNVNPLLAPPIWKCETILHEEDEVIFIKSPLYRTIPVTKEYFEFLVEETTKDV